MPITKVYRNVNSICVPVNVVLVLCAWTNKDIASGQDIYIKWVNLWKQTAYGTGFVQFHSKIFLHGFNVITVTTKLAIEIKCWSVSMYNTQLRKYRTPNHTVTWQSQMLNYHKHFVLSDQVPRKKVYNATCKLNIKIAFSECIIKWGKATCTTIQPWGVTSMVEVTCHIRQLFCSRQNGSRKNMEMFM